MPAYGLTIGVRAACFVPSDWRASWTFRFHDPELSSAHWSAVCAAMIAIVAPPTVILAGVVLVPLVGWRLAGMHALLVGAVVVFLIELVALTVPFVPFTRAYEPGHATLNTRWWVYVLGLVVFVYAPARVELWWLDQPASLLKIAAVFALGILTLETIGRRRVPSAPTIADEDVLDDVCSVTVLNLSGA